MEKKLITFEWFQDEVCNEGCDFYNVSKRQCRREENKKACDLWNELESPEENITIVPANGAKRNGWM